MAQYLLSVYQPEGEAPQPETLAGIMENVAKLEQEMRDAGAWVFSGGLEAPSTATVVRTTGELLPNGSLSSDEVLLTDGPFIEAKEYLGGLTVIEAEDLDEALRWGRKTAATIGLPIEVRPFHWAGS
ncbi:YciI family protein [Cryptosporangium minutisporangium]|uniref:YciI family protein n=1 Tax=Cryptosporangium minutisporangium TaxID=113569 RepID=A0ABP6T678_9ACTN